MANAQRIKKGQTLLETIMVLVALVLLGVGVLTTFSSLNRDSIKLVENYNNTRTIPFEKSEGVYNQWINRTGASLPASGSGGPVDGGSNPDQGAYGSLADTISQLASQLVTPLRDSVAPAIQNARDRLWLLGDFTVYITNGHTPEEARQKVAEIRADCQAAISTLNNIIESNFSNLPADLPPDRLAELNALRDRIAGIRDKVIEADALFGQAQGQEPGSAEWANTLTQGGSRLGQAGDLLNNLLNDLQ